VAVPRRYSRKAMRLARGYKILAGTLFLAFALVQAAGSVWGLLAY
jgi:hypothetical protein